MKKKHRQILPNSAKQVGEEKKRVPASDRQPDASIQYSTGAKEQPAAFERSKNNPDYSNISDPASEKIRTGDREGGSPIKI